MKAIVIEKYGSPDVLQFKEVERPTPNDNQVLVRVQAASANPLDWHLMRGEPFIARLMGTGLLKPKSSRVGADVAGRVEAVGKDVTQFKPGDEVFGTCNGSFAEYACAREDRLALKPANVSFEEAAAIPVAATTALQGLRNKGQIQPGQKVLVNGASGGVGTFAVQLAKSFEAEVSGVDSTGKLGMLRSIGADKVIDYTKDDFTKSGETYDVIFDVVGKASYSGCIRSLKENGYYHPGLSQQFRGLWTSTMSRKKVVGGMVSYRTEDLVFLRELIEAGKIRSVIDRRYPVEQVAEAHRYVDTGQEIGNVVVTVG